jgi:hypothetical protein
MGTVTNCANECVTCNFVFRYDSLSAITAVVADISDKQPAAIEVASGSHSIFVTLPLFAVGSAYQLGVAQVILHRPNPGTTVPA